MRCLLPLLLLTLTSFAQDPLVGDIKSLPSRIGFGSCSNQDRPQPVLDHVSRRNPELFIYLGDNIYGDTDDMGVLRAKYAKLAARPEFRRLRAKTPLIATWDDHDYGTNDGGEEYAEKAESREIFLDFWRVPKDSPQRQHPGVYHSYLFTDGKKRMQVILLDTRSFRSPLVRAFSPSWKNDYLPDPDPKKTILGAEQWKWLEKELRVPADLRVIGSSIQFGHEYNGWESWTNFPSELRRMIDLIKSTRANGVVFISGDVHWGEMSMLDLSKFSDRKGYYPIYDVTSSGINQDWDHIEPNRNRVGQAVAEHNYGWLEMDWTQADPALTMQIGDESGTIRVSRTIPLSDLRFK